MKANDVKRFFQNNPCERGIVGFFSEDLYKIDFNRIYQINIKRFAPVLHIDTEFIIKALKLTLKIQLSTGYKTIYQFRRGRLIKKTYFTSFSEEFHEKVYSYHKGFSDRIKKITSIVYSKRTNLGTKTEEYFDENGFAFKETVYGIKVNPDTGRRTAMTAKHHRFFNTNTSIHRILPPIRWTLKRDKKQRIVEVVSDRGDWSVNIEYDEKNHIKSTKVQMKDSWKYGDEFEQNKHSACSRKELFEKMDITYFLKEMDSKQIMENIQ